MQFSSKITGVLGLIAIAWPAALLAQQVQVPLKYTVPALTVTGTATAEVIPNLAILSLGVETERPKAQEAAGENANLASALIDKIKAQGIEARDIRTESVTLTPQYDEAADPDGRLIKRTLRGYAARNEFSLRVRSLDKAGAMARQFMDSGANIFNGISFDYDQKDQRMDVLRADAARDALRQANIYATALGLKLGRILEIAPPSPEAGTLPPPMQARAFSKSSGGGPVPVEPGVQTLRSEVEVVWEVMR